MSVSLINNVLYSLLLLCPLVVIFCSAVIGRDTPKTGRSGLIGPRRYQTGWWRGWIGWTTYEGRNVERTKVTRSQRNQSCHEHDERRGLDSTRLSLVPYTYRLAYDLASST